MPLPHRTLATWYTLLSQQLDAGVTMVEALRLSGGAAAGPANAIAGTIARGGSFDNGLRAAGRALPLPDLLTISAAARIGRLPAALRSLAERHARLHTVKRRIAMACVYPVILVHLGAALFPLAGLIDWQKGFLWDPVAYARGVASILVPVWTLAALLFFGTRRWPNAAFAVGSVLPAIGGFLRSQALADLAFTLSGFVASGVTVSDAWAAVATLTRSRRLRRASLAMHAVAEGGRPPGDRLGEWSVFPTEFTIRYRTAEQTGQLDRSLADLSQDYQQRADRALTATALLYPALLFMIVAGGVVYAVVSIYSGYLRMLTKMAE